jgi:uncharacterized protein
MRYTEYGSTGKKVSVIGFGGMRFDQELPDEQNAELVRYACSQGINYFDTAPGYGRSEDIFGIALKDMPGEYYVSTKAMPTSHETAKSTREAVMKSLERLGVPKIHFFHVWCLRKMEHFELAMQKGGMYEELLRCKDEGLIDHIVFSSHQPGSEIKTMLDTGKFDGVLLGMNVLNFPYRWDGAQAAHDGGYGCVVMNPLAGGAIPKNEVDLSYLAEEGETPTEAAIRFTVSCPQITVGLVGFTTKEHVDMACAVADRAEPFSDERLAEIRQHLSTDMNEICTGCGYCAGCPKNIPVAAYMQFYNDKKLFGKTDAEMKSAISSQHDWFLLACREADAGECVECGECEEKCTQHLDIINRLKEIAEWERAAG